MEQNHDRLRLYWTFVVAGLLMLVGVASAVLPGAGLQATLNVADGFDSRGFTLSRDAAMNEITERQGIILQWALGRLDEQTFKSRYGTQPRVRTFMMGEIMRAADEERSKINVLRSKLTAIDPEMLEAARAERKTAQRKRAIAMRVFEEFGPTITRVERERAPWGWFLVLSYKLSLPEGLMLSFLPCKLEYGDGLIGKIDTYEFDCLFTAKRGEEYRIRLGDVVGSELSNLEFDFAADYSRAIVISRPKSLAFIDPVELSIPEIEELENAIKKMKSIIDEKSYI